VSLDAECVLSGVTTGPVDSIVATPAPHRFIRPEVTNVVSGLKQKSLVGAFFEQLGQQRHQLEQLEWLKQQFRIIRGPAHCNRELELPVLRACRDELVHQLAQLRDNERGDLRVDTGSDAVLPDGIKRLKSR